jgi:hypothetical protein
VKRNSTLGVAALALLLSGCGGGGGGSSSDVRTFSVPIVWAARSRALQSPASASSATVTLEGAGKNGNDVAAFAERGDGASARTTNAVSTSGVRPGTYPMTVEFTTGSGGSGDVVATASAIVRVGNNGVLQNADGTPLSGVTNVSTVATVEIAPGQVIPLTETRPLTVSVRDAQGGLIAVPAGAVHLAITTGTAAEVVNGQLRGVSTGMVSVTATVDGVASPSTLVQVARKQATVQQIKMGATSLTYLPLVNRLYVGVGVTAYGFGEEVLTLNPENAAVGPRVAVGTPVQRISVAPDGSRAYVVTDNSTKIRVVNLQSGAALGEIVPGSDVTAVAVSPTDSAMVAVTTATGGLALYRDGTKLAAPEGVETIGGPVVFNPAGTALYATRNGAVVRVATTNSGLGAIVAGTTVGNPIAVRGNRVFLSNGAILEAMTVQSLSTLPLEEGVPVAGIAISPSGERAFVLTGNSLLGSPSPTLQVFDTAALVKTDEYGLTIPTGPWFELMATGEDSVAFTSVFTRTSDPSVLLAKLD